jgi:hypothetical protein
MQGCGNRQADGKLVAMNILFSLALFGLCYLISAWVDRAVLDAALLYLLLRILDRS